MNENQFERLVLAFERIAAVSEKWYNATHPERELKEVKITRVKTDEDRLKEEQGDTGEESLQDWTDIGRHEADFIATQKVGQGRPKD
jgi:hypothetical protein